MTHASSTVRRRGPWVLAAVAFALTVAAQVLAHEVGLSRGTYTVAPTEYAASRTAAMTANGVRSGKRQAAKLSSVPFSAAK